MERDYQSNDSSHYSRRNMTLAMPEHKPLDRKHETMERPPNYESPIGAMPQPPQEHSGQQIAICFYFAPTITAERYVKIISKPGTQANVPAAPKILQAGRQVRLAKI